MKKKKKWVRSFQGPQRENKRDVTCYLARKQLRWSPYLRKLEGRWSRPSQVFSCDVRNSSSIEHLRSVSSQMYLILHYRYVYVYMLKIRHIFNRSIIWTSQWSHDKII